jgi:uncharacterized membrane protein YhaH (DUF805 family)
VNQINQELLQYAEFGLRIVPAVLAIVLASLVGKLAGKGWLVATVVINFVDLIGYSMVNILLHNRDLGFDVVSRWYAVLSMVSILGMFCFGVFIFSIYIASRLTLNVNDLLFSFSGRIPRSAFWIWVCVAYPCGMLIGFPVHQLLTDTDRVRLAGTAGFPVIVLLVLYACCCILSTWMALAVYAKRWHDCCKSGWMTLIVFVPVIGGLWLIGYLGFVQGDNGPNVYGEDPFNLQQGRADRPGIAWNA